MLKRIIKSVAFLGCSVTAMTGFIGCVADRHDIQQLPEGGVDLVLEISASKTRADGNDFTKAEKVVKSVDLFFYPEGASDNTQATHHIHTGVTMNTDAETSNRGKIRINIEPEDIGLSSSVTSCLVYAAVNTAETKDADNITLGELKNIMTSTDWMIKNTLDESVDMPDFEGFAMFTISPGGDVVELTYDNGEAKISGTVIVDKLMSKISLFLGFGSKDEEPDISTWTVSGVNPNEPENGTQNWRVYQPSEEEKQEGDASVFGDEVELYIVNGVKAARLGGAFAEDGSFIPTLKDDDYFDLWAEDTTDSENDFMNFAHGFIANGQSDSKAKYPYVVESPFYTYPNSWTDGVLNTDTYLILKVNWIPVDGDATNVEDKLLETYYKVPLNKSEGAADQNKILSNCHYSVKVKINTLGGLHFGEPLLLDDCSYELIPWDHMVLDAKLRETRYLEVRQDVVDRDGQHYTGIMNNSTTISIPFYSSHKVEIREATVTYYDFQYTKKGEDDLIKPNDRIEYINTDAKIKAFTLTEDLLGTDTPGIFIDEINSRIVIQHLFHPITLSGSGDRYVHVTQSTGTNETRVLANTYSPFDFHIVLKHKDWDNTFKLDEINVRQYPPRYIEITKNEGGPTESGWLGTNKRNYGHVLINGARNAFGGASGITEGRFNSFIFGTLLGVTDNPMMYIVNVTNLNPDDVVDYPLHIGDPRMIYTSNDLWTKQEKTGKQGDWGSDHYTYEDLLPNDSKDDDTPASWSTNAQGWLNHESTGSRQLTNYYPTNETPLNEYRYMISPRFRVGSSYGNAGESFGRVRARKRCASYQEDRYPAGRWRLPTPGEMFFMLKLQQENVIMELFSDGEAYWTSHGLFKTGKDSRGRPTITEQREAEGVFSGKEKANGDDAGALSSENYVIKGYTRCVYDEWYWQADDGEPDIINFPLVNNSSDFRWGDKHKNNPQLQPNPETEPEP